MRYLGIGCLLGVLLSACAADQDSITSPTLAITAPCDPIGPSSFGQGALGPCNPEVPDLNPNAAGVWNGYSLTRCVAPVMGEDLDLDVFADYCENALAANFAPKLMVHTAECDGWLWDGTVSPGRLGGEYYYVVQSTPSTARQRVVIVYMMAYYKDCGSTYLGGAHKGDSEFIAVDLTFDTSTNHWVTWQVFLSAHCGASIMGYPVNQYCHWYAGSGMLYDRYLAAPIVYVSANKHANYPNSNVCYNAFGGSWVYQYEKCENSSYPLRFPTQYVWQNAGSRAVPNPWSSTTCPYAVGEPTDGALQECIWNNGAGTAGFFGWQWRGLYEQGGTGYGALLSNHLAL